MDMQKWLRYDAAHTHFERYDRGGQTFISHIIMLDKTSARSYEPIKQMHHYMSAQKSKSSSDPHQREGYGDSHVQLWWCDLKA